jgi:hypothetical protein
VLTEGAGFAYKSNIVPEAIAVLTGLRTDIVGLSKKQDAVIDKATRAWPVAWDALSRSGGRPRAAPAPRRGISGWC